MAVTSPQLCNEIGSSGIQNTGGTGLYGNSIQHGTFNITQANAKDPFEKVKVLQYFGPVDPKLERYRILHGKDRVLVGSSSWVLNDRLFSAWLGDSPGSGVLWIRGDPGKGKTMIFASILEELSRQSTALSESERPTMAYFLCQRTDSRLNTPEAVVKGLIYSLLTSNSPHEAHLYDHLRATYVPGTGSHPGGASNDASEDPGAMFWKIWTTLDGILSRANISKCYFLIDALDEISTDVTTLLECILRHPLKSQIRWLITSRSEPQIRELLEHDPESISISLENNAQHVSRTVEEFIESKVAELRHRKRYPETLAQTVRSYLRNNATGTFLWVSLVCKQLQGVRLKDTEQALATFPSGLRPLYTHMLAKVEQQDNKDDVEICCRMLRMTALARWPQTLRQMAVFCGVSTEDEQSLREAEDLVERCGSFLSIQQTDSQEVHFIHQSCSDFFSKGDGTRLFNANLAEHHLQVANTCFDVLDRYLKRDVCNVMKRGISAWAARREGLSIPSELEYAGQCWIFHLLACGDMSNESVLSLLSQPHVRRFFKSHLMHWLELLGWVDTSMDVILEIAKLWDAMYNLPSRLSRDQLLDIDYDTLRKSVVHTKTLVSRNTALHANPLQVYQEFWLLPAILETNIREGFWDNSPSWISVPLRDQIHGIFKKNEDCTSGLITAPDGSFIVTMTALNYPRLWNTETGQLQKELRDSSILFNFSVQVTKDSRYVVVLGDECNVSVWLVDKAKQASRVWSQSLAEPGSFVSMALCPLNRHIVLVDTNGDGMLVNFMNGQRVQALPRSAGVNDPKARITYAAAFSEEGSQLIIGLEVGYFTIWSLSNLVAPTVIQSPTPKFVYMAEWSGSMLALSLAGGQIVVYDTTSMEICLSSKLFGGSARNLEFHDGTLAASHYDGTLSVWDMTTPNQQESWWTWTFPKDKLWTPDGALLAPHTSRAKPLSVEQNNSSSLIPIIVTDDGSEPSVNSSGPVETQLALPFFSLDENMTHITVAGKPVRALPFRADRCSIINGETIIISAMQHGLEFIHLDKDEYANQNAASEGTSPVEDDRTPMKRPRISIGREESDGDVVKIRHTKRPRSRSPIRRLRFV